MSDVTHQKRGLRFEKSLLIEFLRPNGRVEFLPPKKKVDFRRYYGGCARGGGGGGGADGKVVIERLCRSLPHVEKPFNSKVIKSFVPELRSRKCFCVSGFLCYLYMSYEHSMYISHIRIMGILQIFHRF